MIVYYSTYINKNYTSHYKSLHRKDQCIWRCKSRYWLGTGTSMWWVR